MNDDLPWSPTPVTFQHLAPYGFDLTERAARGELQLGEYHQAGFDRMWRVMARRRRNDPVLLNGSVEQYRAVVEAFAYYIVKGNAPMARRLFYNERIVWLNLDRLFEGVDTSDEFDMRFDPLLREIEANHVTLYVENVEKILGHCVPDVANNAPVRFRSGVRRGEYRLISTSTLNLKEFTDCVFRYPPIDRSLAMVPLDSLPPVPAENLSPSE